MANTVMNPCIPYVGPIPGGLQNGSQIVISGVPEHHHNGFVISLQAGPSIEPRSDTAFVFHVRFNESCVVRNTLQYGNWGTEERGDGFPFQRGVPMEVIILVKPHHYKVSVNGRHFCQYNHRLQKKRVSHITVEQGLRVNYIRFEGRGGGYPTGPVPPPAAPAGPYAPGPAGPYPAPGGQPVYNPPVPFVQNIPGGIYPGKMIYVSGIPHPGGSRFNVNFLAGPDNAFTFDVRFNYGNDRHVLVRNAMQHGTWGNEERHQPSFPFAYDKYFDMIILVEPECYKVAVNNQHLLEFHHRVRPINRVDTLRIEGDLRLTQVRFQ